MPPLQFSVYGGDEDLSSRQQLFGKDDRLTQLLAAPLSDIITLDELRRQRQHAGEDQTFSSSSNLPPLNRTQQPSSPDDGFLSSKHARDRGASWAPLPAARQQLATEKPEMIERMDKTVSHCRIACDNRNYRLNSLGAFEADKNEVRARSMLRVQLHKELSTTSMRLPQHHKEVKLERPEDSLPARLERMCHKVVRSIHDDLQQRATLKGKDRQRHARVSHHNLHLAVAAEAQAGQEAGGPGAPVSDTPTSTAGRSIAQRSLSMRSAHYRRMSSSVNVRTGGAPRSPGTGSSLKSPNAAAKYEWLKGPLPPEVAEAHMAHLTALTARHIERYHSAVVSAQESVALRSGLERGALEMSAEEMEAVLQAELKEQDSLLQHHHLPGGSELKPVSRRLLGARSIPGLITAALEHLDLMHADLEEFKAALPVAAKASSSSPTRRKKPSIPMGQRQAGGSGASASTPTTASAGTATGAGGDMQEVWPSFSRVSQRMQPQQVPLGMRASSTGGGSHPPRSAATSVATGRDDDCYLTEEEEGGEEEDSQQDGASSSGGSSPSLKPSASGGTSARASSARRSSSRCVSASPAPPPPPTEAPIINHTPITAKRLEELRRALEAAEAAGGNADMAQQLPALPELPGAPSGSTAVQARLERVWNMLLMPLTVRLDMVLEFTRRERALQFERALGMWERAAVGVVHREEVLAGLTAVQRGVEEGTVSHLSVSALERQCVALQAATAYVRFLGRTLREQHGMELTYEGAAYPGGDAVEGGEAGVVTADHMVSFFEWLRDKAVHVRLLN